MVAETTFRCISRPYHPFFVQRWDKWGWWPQSEICVYYIYIYIIYVCVRYCAVVLQAENDGLRTSGDSLSPAYGGAFSSPPPSRWTAKPFWVFGLWMLPLSVSPAERKWHPHSQTNIEDDRSIEGKSPSKYLHIKQVMQRDAVMLWLKAIPSHMSCAFRFSIRFPPQDWTPRRGRRCLSFGVGEARSVSEVFSFSD